ncbi:MAG TPA: amidohydrolase [Candidatus Dormibacteraeota bacterium]|nr:amidohydrolase [Candidatus Dormibacteraeota bacterium]
MSPAPGDAVAAAVRAQTPGLVETRRHLHRLPELSGAERETAAFIAQRLGDLGLAPRLLLDGTAVLADCSGGGPGSTLLIRADIDALPITERGADRPYCSERPGVMHACGHDGHVAMALAAAAVLSGFSDRLGGTVRFAFQPAEEVAGGAVRLIAAGALADPTVDAAVGIHLWSGLEVGSVGVRDGAIFASADEFVVEVRGRGGHGALPHQALDPVPVASTLVLALQTLVSRETSPFDAVVVTIGSISGGQTFNVIPETVTLRGTVRAFDAAIRSRILERIEAMAAGITAAAGATAHFTRGAGCPPVVSDAAVAELVRRAVRATRSARLVEAEPLTVGDDMANFLEAVPGCYFLVGAGNRARGITAPHHHPEFDIDEACLPIGAEVLVRAGLAFLQPGRATVAAGRR